MIVHTSLREIFGKDHQYKEVWVTDQQLLNDALASGLCDLYRTCFSTIPYDEVYDDAQISDKFRTELTNKASILLIYDKENKVIAFSVKTPVRNCPENIKKRAAESGKISQSIFGSDLGVHPAHRKLRISTILEKMQAERLLDKGFVREVSRTSISNYPRIASNLKAGKRPLPNTEIVNMLRTDGFFKDDVRMFFKWEISTTLNANSKIRFLKKATIIKIDGNDVAFIDDSSITFSEQAILSQLVIDNYPGVKTVEFLKKDDKIPESKSILFAGSMPLVEMQSDLKGQKLLFGNNLTLVEELLLDKIPTFRELLGKKVKECRDPLVIGKSNEHIYFHNMASEMKKFTGDNIYIRKTILDMLNMAGKNLKEQNQIYQLQVHYGYRHPTIQKDRYDNFFAEIQERVDIQDKEQYTHTFIAEPRVAAHPTGAAVDVTIINRNSKIPIDMGTQLREFSAKTLTFFPDITKQQWFNRNVLRNVMTQAGFCPYDGEWWHFSYGDREWAYHFGKENAIYDTIDFKE